MSTKKELNLITHSERAQDLWTLPAKGMTLHAIFDRHVGLSIPDQAGDVS